MTTTFLRIWNFGLGFTAVAVAASATAVTLMEGDLDNFPGPSETETYRIVIDREIMEVTGRDEATNKLTVTRAQEGTVAVSHSSLALVSLRLTADGVRRMQNAINALEQGLNTVEIRINSGADVGQQPRINFLDGANADFSATESLPNNEVQVTLDVNLDSYTVAALPAGAVGDMAFASDALKPGEGAGTGTGVMVYHDGTGWFAVHDSAVPTT